MTLAKAYKDVTFTIVAGESYVDPETGEVVFKGDNLDAEIVDTDNDSPECYLMNVDYLVRLYKSRDSMTITTRTNFGNIKLYEKKVQEDIENETIIFTGNQDVSSKKFIKDGFTYSPVGLVYTLAGEEYTNGISAEMNSTSISSVEKIVGVYQVSYLTEYDHYQFRSPRTGRMMMFFIGT